MPTPTPGVQIQLDRRRTLRYGGGALMAIEQRTGKNLLKGELGTDLSFTELVTFVWAGLRHEDPELTLEEAADLIDPSRMEEIAEAMGEALNAAFPTGPSATGDKGTGKGRKPRG